MTLLAASADDEGALERFAEDCVAAGCELEARVETLAGISRPRISRRSSTSGSPARMPRSTTAVAASRDAAAVLEHLDRRVAPRARRVRADRHAVGGPPRRRRPRGGAPLRWSGSRRGGAARSRVRTCTARWRRSTSAGSMRPERRHLALWRSSQRVNGAHLDDTGRDAARASPGAGVRARFVDRGGIHRRPAACSSSRRADLDGLPEDVLARLEPGAVPDTVRVPVDYQTRDAFLAHVQASRPAGAVLASPERPRSGDDARADARAVRRAPRGRAARGVRVLGGAADVDLALSVGRRRRGNPRRHRRALALAPSASFIDGVRGRARRRARR